jgi:hypothetical protein
LLSRPRWSPPKEDPRKSKTHATAKPASRAKYPPSQRDARGRKLQSALPSCRTDIGDLPTLKSSAALVADFDDGRTITALTNKRRSPRSRN